MLDNIEGYGRPYGREEHSYHSYAFKEAEGEEYYESSSDDEFHERRHYQVISHDVHRPDLKFKPASPVALPHRVANDGRHYGHHELQHHKHGGDGGWRDEQRLHRPSPGGWHGHRPEDSPVRQMGWVAVPTDGYYHHGDGHAGPGRHVNRLAAPETPAHKVYVYPGGHGGHGGHGGAKDPEIKWKADGGGPFGRRSGYRKPEWVAKAID